MKILIACEFSGRVREAFRSRGHDAWSADLLPTEIPGPHRIMSGHKDLHDLLYNEFWDLVIGHPPCQRLTIAASWYIKRNDLDDEVHQAANFFNMILYCPALRVAVENPVQNSFAKQWIRDPDQTIQPYQFGDNARKATCLWLRNLPKLRPSKYIQPVLTPFGPRWGNQAIQSGSFQQGPSAHRQRDRSRTFAGIADAMARQWSPCLAQTMLFTGREDGSGVI